MHIVSTNSTELSVFRRIALHFVSLCVLVALFLLCLSLVGMRHESGSSVVWSALSIVSATIALLAIAVYEAAISLQSHTRVLMKEWARFFASFPFVGAFLALFLGEEWQLVAALLVGSTVLVYFGFVAVEHRVGNLLQRLEDESPP